MLTSQITGNGEPQAISDLEALLTAQSLVGIIEWDKNFHVSRWNARAESIFGYRSEDVIGRDGAFLVPESSPAKLNAAWQEILSQREGSRYQGRALHGSGKYITVDWFNKPMIDKQGDVTGVLSIVQDLTAYRDAAQELTRTTELLERTGELAKVGGWQLDIPTQTLTWSRQTFMLADLDPSREPPLADGINLFAPAARPVISAAVAAAIEHGTPYDLELPWISAKGRHLWVRTQGFAELDGGKPVRLFGTICDITESKQAADASNANERRFRAIIDASPTPMALNDAAQNITFLNPAFTRVFGYTQEDIPTLADWWPKAYPSPEYRQWVVETWQAEMVRSEQTGTPFSKMAITILAKDGTVRYVQASAAPVDAGLVDSHLVVLEDVTEAKIASENLHAADHQVNVLVNSTNAIVWEEDVNSLQVMTVTQNVERVLGYPSAEWLQPGFWASHIHPDDRDQTVNFVSAQLGHAQVFSVEYRFLAADNRTVWLRDKINVTMEGGQPRWLRGVTTDITEEKRAASALRESENRWRFAIEGSGDGLWDWDIPSGTVFFSQRWKSMIGFDDAEIGNGVDEWRRRVHPDDLATAEVRLRTHFADSRSDYRLEHRMRCKDGSWKWILARGLVIERAASGEAIRMIGTHTDISVRRATEEALRASAEALSNISQGVLITDETRSIVSANAAFTKITGYSELEILGRNCDFLHGPLTDPKTKIQISQAVTAGAEFNGEIVNYRKDGTAFWNDLTMSPVRNADGAVVQYVGVTRDVTERRRAEEERAALEEQLRESQKMEAIGTLAGGIAHDFNNILAAIQGNTALALEDAAGNTQAVESLTEIGKATTRARDLVRQILSFSRRQATTLTNLSLVPVAEESARLLRATLPPRLSLRLDIAANLPNVNADATQIEQVLINLATNAMQAMREGRGQIDIILDTVLLDHAYTAAHPQTYTMLTAHPGQQAVRLMVRDNGPGMDAATRARVFEPFFTTKPVGEGTGLGLSVVHGIAQKHDGVIFLESELGHGTTFTLLLPASAEHANNDPGLPIATPSLQLNGGRHILYLDDDEALVFLCARLFERRGHRVTTFTNQNEALAALKADPFAFDVLVTDYNMPGASGLDVARAALAIRPDLPLAVASGFVDDALQAEAVAIGVFEVMLKATDVNEFCEAVDRLANKVESKQG